MSGWDLLEQAYRLAFLAYPSSFRERFGDEMITFARERMCAAREYGPRAVLGESVTLAFDFLRSVPGQWLLAARDRRLSRFTPAAPLPNSAARTRGSRTRRKDLMAGPA